MRTFIDASTIADAMKAAELLQNNEFDLIIPTDNYDEFISIYLDRREESICLDILKTWLLEYVSLVSPQEADLTAYDEEEYDDDDITIINIDEFIENNQQSDFHSDAEEEIVHNLKFAYPFDNLRLVNDDYVYQMEMDGRVEEYAIGCWDTIKAAVACSGNFVLPLTGILHDEISAELFAIWASSDYCEAKKRLDCLLKTKEVEK